MLKVEKYQDCQLMNSKIKNTVMTKLRFPEFLSKSGWDRLLLFEITDLITKGTTPTTLGFQYVDSGIKFIKIESIDELGNIINSKVAFITKECDEALQRSRLKVGDILFSIAGALGVVAFVKQDVLPANTNQALAIVRTKRGYNRNYLVNYLKSPTIISEISKIKAGAAQPNISLSQLGNFTIFLPSLAEQQKIADCLSSLDDLITAESQKLEALKDHKKGIMQQLFPAEGETVPKLRFVEFRESGDWEAIALGEVADVSKLAGYEFTAHIVYKNTGSIVALRGLNIKKNRLDLTDVKYIDDSDFSKLSRSKLFIDDLMFTYIGTIGEVALIKENNKYYLAPNVSRIRVNKNVLNPRFILQIFNIPSFKEKEVAKYISSSSQPALTMESVRKFLVKKPSLSEQQKISDCLSSLDEFTTIQAEKIEQLKIHKKGLMQGLFPNLNNSNI